MSYCCVICSEKSALSTQNTTKFLEYLHVCSEFMEVKSIQTLLLKRLKLPSDNTRYCIFFLLEAKNVLWMYWKFTHLPPHTSTGFKVGVQDGCVVDFYWAFFAYSEQVFSFSVMTNCIWKMAAISKFSLKKFLKF